MGMDGGAGFPRERTTRLRHDDPDRSLVFAPALARPGRAHRLAARTRFAPQAGLPAAGPGPLRPGAGLPTPAGLSASGQVALGLLVLVVTLWISECVSPANSAVLLTGMAVVGLMGKPLTPGAKPMGSADALTVMLGGFSSTAVLLVAAALFLAVALKHRAGPPGRPAGDEPGGPVARAAHAGRDAGGLRAGAVHSPRPRRAWAR